MNRTITLPELADRIAASTGISRSESEAFVKDLFALVSERLADGDDVTLKGLGRFAVVGDRVEFCPDPEFADGVNMPFAAFEAIELDDDITPEMLEGAVPASAPKQEPLVEPEPDPEPVLMAESELGEELAEEAADDPEPEDDAVASPEDTPVPTPADTDVEESEAEPDMVDEHADRSPWWNRSLWIILFILWGVLCYFVGYMTAPMVTIYSPDSNYKAVMPADTASVAPDEAERTIVADTVAVMDTVAAPEAAAQVENVVVTDTIRRNRYLTTMSREHYGMMDFWVYIYEENADRLGDPNRIDPGTVVVIPPASKYGIDRNNPEAVRKAKLKAVEIYAPYQK